MTIGTSLTDGVGAAIATPSRRSRSLTVISSRPDALQHGRDDQAAPAMVGARAGSSPGTPRRSAAVIGAQAGGHPLDDVPGQDGGRARRSRS